MPPKAQPRKGPGFKPPRPVKPAAQAARPSAKRASDTADARAGASKKAATAGLSFQAAATLISSDSELEDEESPQNTDLDEDMVDELSPQRAPATTAAYHPEEQTTAPIPLPLLARLLHEGFDDKGMKMQQGALELAGKYMETFVREAIARAQFERGDADKGGAIQDGFLQVEDLEKLAPQLVLDF
ncbi:hypothetical protein GQ43DRAFT_443996 [Delitschia confertaspora ATCC 74209]|uniref:Centromere protein X n=1 Tax=Delitschia confertaspora ATCC 74209 TaxID=1513339 RepID=A0A9P4JE50_9PLEO|nr:hypothetical protein GQ43DRAFT_443996 [Delitschia confertaspora ATCC 74209]